MSPSRDTRDEIVLTCDVSAEFALRVRRIGAIKDLPKWKVLQLLFDLACDTPGASTSDYGKAEEENCQLKMGSDIYFERTEAIRTELLLRVKKIIFKECLYRGMAIYEAQHGPQLPT